ncbi:hypothetical protein J5226_12855 [Lysobacter sp. K5869]|uniref:hypothetical protein n=1 Tax=Lysobacter sp. K5869 TaxID=2820808 RepID=UPI001C06388E|nr:hypothetical protein [Lysobacter sp. K5869]QWP79214.1 hypothetical protein J5226_12855 [Lysobacter sp. K5869]
MSPDQLEILLRLWGAAYGEHRPREWDEPSSPGGMSPLARAAEFAPGRKVRRLDAAYRRACRAVRGGRPEWASDPVRFTETRVAGSRAPTGGARSVLNPEASRVEAAVLRLQRVDDTLGQIVRAEYCRRGGQGDKARAFEMGRGQFREAVAEGRGWLRRELAS